MLGLGNAESSRACALIAALDAQEITLQEFSEAITPLTSEALQVTATILSCCADLHPERGERLWFARAICSRTAASTRCLC
jgi:hypothetical protein